MNKDYFIEELTKLDITLEDNKLNKLEEYYSLLEEENKKYNLRSLSTNLPNVIHYSFHIYVI